MHVPAAAQLVHPADAAFNAYNLSAYYAASLFSRYTIG